MRFDFASDNTSGTCPQAWEALRLADRGAVASYGDDPWTAQAADTLRSLFGCDADIYFAFNGTAANALALASLCQSYHSVVCAPSAHIETDECGAPEFFSNGTKLLTTRDQDGKVSVAELERLVRSRSDIHYPKPRVVSVTQSTELGTCWTPAEIRAVSAAARGLGLKVHMDGARFAQAVAALGCTARELTVEAGVDVLCFGGSKLGLGFSEAVVFFDRGLSTEFAYRCKQAGQLASKMRYLAAPWAACIADGTWLANARNANRLAAVLGRRLAAIPGVSLVRPVEANAVFCSLPEPAHAMLARGWRYYRFIGGGARFMCSWATTDQAIDDLVEAVAGAVQGEPVPAGRSAPA